MRKYEVMFIVRPDVVDEDLDKLVANLETSVTTAGGHVAHTERMGKRRLAYIVRKFQEGTYILFQVEGPGSVIKEFERRSASPTGDQVHHRSYRRGRAAS